jgi:hypothetical protein
MIEPPPRAPLANGIQSPEIGECKDVEGLLVPAIERVCPAMDVPDIYHVSYT